MQAKANSIEATTISPGRARQFRWGSAAEVVVVTGSVLVLIWVVQPLGSAALDPAFRLLIVASMLTSNIAHRDSLKRVGIRLDNLVVAARVALPPTALAAVVLVVLGLIVAPPDDVAIQRIVLNFAYYIIWGFAQQYALQGFVLLRLIDAGLDRRAPVIAAGLFALVHVPNPGLVAMAFAGGWIWSTLFRRAPNLLVLAASHAALAVVGEAMLPASLTGGYRLGPRYVRWALG